MFKFLNSFSFSSFMKVQALYQSTWNLDANNPVKVKIFHSNNISYSGFKDKIGNISESISFVMIHFKHLFITAEHGKQFKYPLIRAWINYSIFKNEMVFRNF